MAKYSKKASEKVEEVMKERKKGTLKSGSGKKVTSRKQAIAIGLSEARKEGARVPAEKKSSTKKTAKKVVTGKGTAAKKTEKKGIAQQKKTRKKSTGKNTSAKKTKYK